MSARSILAQAGPFIDNLRSVNRRLAGWVAGLSWWRLIVLIIVVLIAGNMISDKLQLDHERVRDGTPAPKRERREAQGIEIKSAKDGESVVVRIGGRETVRITKDGPNAARVEIPPDTPSPPTPPAPPVADPGASGASAPSVGAASATGPGVNPASSSDSAPASAARPAGADAKPPTEKGDDEDTPVAHRPSWRQVFTFRGAIGDLGAVLMILFVSYVVTSKIIVRKVAESDAKVKSAESVAERESVERQLVQAKLQVLQAQVEPHFLFNTLAAVDFLIETDPPRATQMQKALIRYLRGALPQMRMEASTLGREMKLIEAYLELIKMRIEDRLQVDLVVPDGLQTAEFPPMMLQSLVENAIKHGIEPKPEGGKVTVAARIHNGLLWVEVSDTGVGLPGTDIFDGPTTGTGIGLKNIRERISMLYPGKGRLTLRSDDEKGTIVRIGIPYNDTAPHEDEDQAAPSQT